MLADNSVQFLGQGEHPVELYRSQQLLLSLR
jgi:hypothetical protein